MGRKNGHTFIVPSSIPISDLSRDTAKWSSLDKLDGFRVFETTANLEVSSLEFNDKTFMMQ